MGQAGYSMPGREESPAASGQVTNASHRSQLWHFSDGLCACLERSDVADASRVGQTRPCAKSLRAEMSGANPNESSTLIASGRPTALARWTIHPYRPCPAGSPSWGVPYVCLSLDTTSFGRSGGRNARHGREFGGGTGEVACTRLQRAVAGIPRLSGPCYRSRMSSRVRAACGRRGTSHGPLRAL